MAKLILDADEYIVESSVPLRGPVQDFIFKALLGPLTLGVGAAICILVPKILRPLRTDSALAKEPVFRMVGYIYIPLIILFAGLLLYYLLSIYREKIMLTNKAILQRHVFSTDRIPFKDIVSANIRYETFRFRLRSQLISFLTGLLLGINWELIITGTGHREMKISNMTKRRAAELKDKLVAISQQK